MSEDQQKWFKKRSHDEDDDEDSKIIDIDEQDSEESSAERKREWKVKTLDEILQEKRRRTEDDESSSTSLQFLQRDESMSSEVIYQLSPEHNSPLSSVSTPRKSKRSSQERHRKGTEEEEGEILSDISDAEGGTAKPRRRSVKSARQDPEMVEEATHPSKSPEDISSEESNDDDDNADKKEPTVAEGSDESEEESRDSESDSEESSDEEEQTPAEVKVAADTKQESEEESEESSDEEEGSDSEESESSEEEGDKEEPEVSGKLAAADEEEEEEEEEESEDIHKELLKAVDSQKQKERKQREGGKYKQESRYREKERYSDTEQRHKHTREGRDSKSKHRRRSHEEREQYRLYKERYREREEKKPSSRDKREKERDVWEKTGRTSKVEGRDSKDTERPERSGRTSSRDSNEHTTISRDKQGKAESSDSKVKDSDSKKGMEKDVRVSHGDVEQPTSRDKTSRRDRERSDEQSDLSHQYSKSSKLDGNKDRKKDKEARKESSPKEAQSKSREKKESRKPTSEKTDSKAVADPHEHPQDEEMESLVLTQHERMQFSREVVETESDESKTDESSASDSEVEMEQEEEEEEEKNVKEDEEKEPQLPDYLPAVQGCRNVEAFQWLNRIEEGTYGVVYRAKDKSSGDVVALKRLKMEKEKEGFPITSLREINTLLKAQHPNIVHVREIVVGSNMDRIYIVMDYVEHDLKTLMEHMTSPFTVGEVKTLMIQLLRATAHLHDNWILHRDLKTSNLLLNNKGILKVGDFGLAREYGSPLRHYTPIVVTLWYRAPELLLGIKEYSCPIDMWSVGCIFAELLTMKPLFPGKSEIDQINRIFKELGTPSDKIWPGPPSYSELPHVKKMTFAEYPFNQLRNHFGAYLTDQGFGLMNKFLTYDPKKRITADEALKSEYFIESPKPVEPAMFPTWPAKSEMQKRPRRKDYVHSPAPPEGGEMFSKLKDEGDSGGSGAGFHMPTSKKGSAAVSGFNLKF